MNEKILVIEDDLELCELIKKYLHLENFRVEIRHNGEEGLKEALSKDYQVIILDVMLPIKNGFDVLYEMRKVSTVPIIMLTAKDSEMDKVSGLRMGADDYITKPFSMNEFVARVQALIRRFRFNQVNEEKSLSFKNLHLSLDKREVMVNETYIDLTAKEFDLLVFLAQNKGRVYTKKQIYQHVWGNEYAYDDNNIMVHISRLRTKIEPNPQQPIYIQTVWGVGYKFSNEV